MNEFFAPPGHFYSPIVDREEASAALQRSVLSNIIYGIDLNDQKQSELINTLSPYFKNIEISDNKEGEKRYYFINDQYSFGDALIYQAMLRHFKPKRLIEIGSGYSSALALDTRDQHGSPTHLTFIEPYPVRLHSLLRATDLTVVNIIEEKIQNVDLQIFDVLEQDDILFIDSSHVAKTGSDLLTIMFEILPRLRPGVIVHFHDCFWPFEYPSTWAVDQLRSWNEVYFIRAFLYENKKFEVMLFNGYIARVHKELMMEICPMFMKNPGGALWLRVAGGK